MRVQYVDISKRNATRMDKSNQFHCPWEGGGGGSSYLREGQLIPALSRWDLNHTAKPIPFQGTRGHPPCFRCQGPLQWVDWGQRFNPPSPTLPLQNICAQSVSAVQPAFLSPSLGAEGSEEQHSSPPSHRAELQLPSGCPHLCQTKIPGRLLISFFPSFFPNLFSTLVCPEQLGHVDEVALLSSATCFEPYHLWLA